MVLNTRAQEMSHIPLFKPFSCPGQSNIFWAWEQFWPHAILNATFNDLCGQLHESNPISLRENHHLNHRVRVGGGDRNCANGVISVRLPSQLRNSHLHNIHSTDTGKVLLKYYHRSLFLLFSMYHFTVISC